MKRSENETVAIIEKLQQGAALRTVMMPDGALPSNLPLHEETFDLPHVVIQNTHKSFYDLVRKSTTNKHFHLKIFAEK